MKEEEESSVSAKSGELLLPTADRGDRGGRGQEVLGQAVHKENRGTVLGSD